MIGGLVTSTLFTLLVLPTFYLQVHGWLEHRALRAEA
jgi:cobalt-zinc-cadmium resistance protein CzcA